MVMEEAKKERRRSDPWELLYVNDLVLTAETTEIEIMFRNRKQAMEKRGLRLNMDMT